jgi:hypothetical protein
MSHSKGPWTLKHIGGTNFAVQEFDVRGKFGSKEGIYPIFNKGRDEIYGTTIFTSPEDARLIAAAPDLLEALVAVEKLVGETWGHGVKNGYWPTIAPTLHQVRAAIKKATHCE